MSLVILITLLSLLPGYSAANCLIDNCAQCNGNIVCDLCNDGYYLESVTCTRCPLQCTRCTHTSVCQSCVRGYWNPGARCTSQCFTGCDRSGCDDTTGNCYGCNPGKYGPRCDRDCTICRNGECNLMKCTDGCKDGYLLHDSGSGYSDCYPCPNNCTTCSNTTYCTECEQGFYRQYYRNPTTGRVSMWCNQCQVDCTQCTTPDQCPPWCKPECIKQGCEATGSCVTTSSTPHTTSSKGSTTTTNHKAAPTNPISFDTTDVTPTTIQHLVCPDECSEGCDVHGKCLDTTTRYSDSDGSACKCTENNYHQGLGHGIATGIGIAVAVGTLIGIVVYLRRRICHAKSSTDSQEKHVYVNTQEHISTQPVSTERPEYDDVQANSEIRVTTSEQDVDAYREYTSIGERQPEHHYSDLQTN